VFWKFRAEIDRHVAPLAERFRHFAAPRAQFHQELDEGLIAT